MIVEDENGVETYLEPDDGYAKEEPDCGGCFDNGRQRRRILPGWTGCPDCNPSWGQHQRHLWKWHMLGLVAWWPRLRPAPYAAFDDGAPF